jgi:hypothetical protein
VDLVGIELLPKAQGALFTVIGTGALLGTPLAGEVCLPAEFIDIKAIPHQERSWKKKDR